MAGYLGLLEVLRRLDSIEESIRKLWENQNRLWENQNKLWESHNRLWEEVKALRENQNKLWENQNRLWEEVKALRENQNTLWKEVKALRESQERLWRYVRSGFEGVRRALGVSFEEYVASFIEFTLYELGYSGVKAELRKYVLHEGKVIEFNIICVEPLVVAEATLRLESTEEAEDEVRKLMERAEVASKVFGKRPLMLVLAVGNAPQEVVEKLREEASKQGFKLILGREIKEVL